MADMRKVSVALTVEQISTLKAAVKTGDYATTSEIVREALRDWEIKHASRREESRRLRKLWDEGKASGAAAALDFEKLRREARRRLKKATAIRGHGR